MQFREALDVRLVDHRVLPGRARGPVVAPGKGRIHDLALERAHGVVARVERKVPARAVDLISVVGIRPAQPAFDHSRIRIEQQLVRIETVAELGIVRPMHAVPI
jgi:hypothetical protein